ncbi:MAG TPA: tetratricopeptide repeat protein, partial [Polyangiaceae bacterium]|nr:tetratricopeptide repeat protein [Polyangiaceae bacterium]
MLRLATWLLALTVLCLAPWGRADVPDAAGAAQLDDEVEKLSHASRFEDALAKAKRALALREKALPASHWRIGASKSDVGALYLLLDDHVRAEPMLQDAVKLLESGNPNSKELAVALSNLAALHRKRGEIGQAIALNERALAIYEKVSGPEHALVAVQKRTLALLLGRDDHARAEQLLKSAIAIHDKNKDDRGVVADMVALAGLRRLNAKPGVEEMYEQAIARAAKLPPDDPMQARLRISLASEHRRTASSAGSPEGTARVRKLADEQFADAERTLLRIYGANHTELADLYSEWAFNAEAANDLERAVALRTKANDIEERHLAAVLASGSEYVKQQYLRKLQQHTEDTLGLHKVWQVRKFPESVPKLVLTTVLRRKGRVLDAVSDDLATLRKHAGPEERKLLDELLTVRAELAAATIRGPSGSSYKEKLEGLSRRAASLEAKVSERSAAFRAASTPITLDAVRAAIPADAALVEIVRYAPRDPKAYSGVGERWSARYVAYVVRRTGKVRATYLSEADSIDTVVNQFRKSLSNPDDRKVGDPAWRLFAQTFARIEPLLDGAKRVLIAPDGALNIVPFGALMDEKGFLAERYTF